MKSAIYKIVATGFGAGYSPVAPGTAGSLLACLMLIAAMYPQAAGWQVNGQYHIVLIVAIVLFILAGVIATNFLEKNWGKDPSRIVVDEIVGMWIALLWIEPGWGVMIAAFFLFRIFDIWKPLYIRRLEKIGGGWGVMLDDVLAGVYTNLLIQLVLYWLP